MFIITVKGNILAEDKIHYAQEWTSSVGSRENSLLNPVFEYDRQKHIVKGDLVFNKNIRSVPYAAYLSEQEICAKPPSDICGAPGAKAAELCYKDNIAELENLMHINIPSEIETYFYNGLLTGIFSVFELFLSDVLLCMIFNNYEAYKRALDYLKENKIKLDKVDIDSSVQQYFTERIVYHKFDIVRRVFKNILQIEIPDTEKIKSFLPKRNNITHRFAFSNHNRMQRTTIDIETLHNFISHCNEFVEKLMKEINKTFIKRKA